MRLGYKYTKRYIKQVVTADILIGVFLIKTNIKYPIKYIKVYENAIIRLQIILK